MDEATKKAGRTAIKLIAGTLNVDIVQIINCEVLSVDKSARTCNVKPLSGRSDTEIDDVGLMPEKNDGELKIPSIGSTVGVAMSTQVDPYVISWSDLDEWYLVIGKTIIDVLSGSIKLGDGTYHGLVKVGDLTTKLNNLETLVNDILSGLQGITVTIPSGGGAVPFAPFFTESPLTPTQQSDIENDKITHGKIT